MLRTIQSITMCLLLMPVVRAQDSSAARLLEQANESYRTHRPAEAVRLYQEYLARYGNRADVRVFLGAAFLNQGKAGEALEQARIALQLEPGFARAYVLAGRVYAGRSEWSLAQKAFTGAERLDPKDREAWYFSGRAYYEENRFDKAIEALRRVLALGGEQSRVHEMLGLAYDGLGDIKNADAAYRRAIAIAGSDARPFHAYGAFLLRQGKTAQAMDLLAEALRRDPASVDTRFELAKAQLNDSRPAEAVRLLREAIAMSGECRLHSLLAKAYALQGLHEDAGREFTFVEGCWQVSSSGYPEERR